MLFPAVRAFFFIFIFCSPLCAIRLSCFSTTSPVESAIIAAAALSHRRLRRVSTLTAVATITIATTAITATTAIGTRSPLLSRRHRCLDCLVGLCIDSRPSRDFFNVHPIVLSRLLSTAFIVVHMWLVCPSDRLRPFACGFSLRFSPPGNLPPGVMEMLPQLIASALQQYSTFPSHAVPPPLPSSSSSHGYDSHASGYAPPPSHHAPHHGYDRSSRYDDRAPAAVAPSARDLGARCRSRSRSPPHSARGGGAGNGPVGNDYGGRRRSRSPPQRNRSPPRR
jgi:hypothetical protein